MDLELNFAPPRPAAAAAPAAAPAVLGGLAGAPVTHVPENDAFAVSLANDICLVRGS